MKTGRKKDRLEEMERIRKQKGQHSPFTILQLNHWLHLSLSAARDGPRSTPLHPPPFLALPVSATDHSKARAKLSIRACFTTDEKRKREISATPDSPGREIAIATNN